MAASGESRPTGCGRSGRVFDELDQLLARQRPVANGSMCANHERKDLGRALPFKCQGSFTAGDLLVTQVCRHLPATLKPL
jgi:hypothetical protein